MSEVDPFDEAHEGFVKSDDLLGRLLLVTVQESGERESTIKGAKAGDMYVYVETDTVVLDGDVTDLIESVPCSLGGFQFSGQRITAQLLPPLKKKLRGAGNGIVLGRLTQVKSQSFTTMAWVLSAPTDADKAIARNYIANAPAPADPWDKAAG